MTTSQTIEDREVFLNSFVVWVEAYGILEQTPDTLGGKTELRLGDRQPIQ